jgi:Phosphotransferase System HPr (HPr) Family
MMKKDVAIQLENGLEARPVAMLVQLASQFESEIHIASEDRKVNAKSIMGMMTLGLGNGEKVTVYAEGADEVKAVESISQYLTSQK